MEKIIDMHTHTCYSDGELSPNELLLHAKKHNIKTLSITDHDTVKGIENLDKELINDIEFYPGIELTAKVNKGRMHILGYNIDIANKTLLSELQKNDDNVFYTMMSYFDYLKNVYNISFSSSDIKEILNANRNIGRPDIALLMIKYGYVNSVNEAFDKYLSEMHNVLRFKSKDFSPKQCIDIILSSGGIPVIAHPHSLLLNDRELFDSINELKEMGLKGIEVYHSNHSVENTESYKLLAENLDLLISGGSDFHGKSVKPDVEIGTGRNNNVYIKELSLTNKNKSIY